MTPRLCTNCQRPLHRRAPAAAGYCTRYACQLARQRATRAKHLVMHYCRHCGDPVGYGHRRWCRKPECQDAQKAYRTARRHELQAIDAAEGNRPKRVWGKKNGIREATGRRCKCGKEIYRIRDAHTGLVTFDSYFHCDQCDWPKEDEVINEEFAYV